MRCNLGPAAICVALVLTPLIPVPSVALGLDEAECESRFRKALQSHVDPGDSIDVYLLHGAWVRGHFEGFTVDGLGMRVQASDHSQEAGSHALSDVGILKYRKAGRIRPDVMFAGLFVGTVIGALATAALTDDTCSGSELCIPSAVGGGVVGGGIGLVLGTIVPSLIPTTRTVQCGVE